MHEEDRKRLNAWLDGLPGLGLEAEQVDSQTWILKTKSSDQSSSLPTARITYNPQNLFPERFEFHSLSDSQEQA